MFPLLLTLAGCEITEGGGGWITHAHPCFGNRTDTLWADSVDHLWVGCGSTTEGYGLFESTDGGATWAAPDTTPAAYFSDFRVDSVSRSADGLLYVAGTGGTDRVLSIDDAGAVTTVFASASQTWNSFQVGTFRRSDAGVSVAESLTGVDLAWRASDDDAFADGYGWWTSGDSVQILDLDVEGDGFYGAGSTISQPPMVFLPPATDPGGFALDPVILDETITGELWAIDADPAGLVAGGVDQDRDVGVVFTANTLDARAPEDWSLLDLGTLYDDSTWVRGVCRRGDAIGVVGEHSRTGEGLALCSEDAGDTWQIVTPTGAPALSRCTFVGDTVIVAGAEGFVARR